ncbi:MAG TPA: hypothetical protein VF763_14430 [Candidatus Limnocylindrales bacterium]
MGARTDAARQEVLARRHLLSEEVGRLEAAGRAAADIPAKVRKAPARTAGLAAGSAFLVLGGPQRLYRRARRMVLGPKADLPKSLLPKQVDKAVRSLGDDGERVRRTLEREFFDYIESRRKEREGRDLQAALAGVLTSAVKPVASRVGKQLAEQLLQPDQASFEAALERIRARRSGGAEPAATSSTPSASGAGATAGPGHPGPLPPAQQPKPPKR